MTEHHHDREQCKHLAERLSEYLDDELPPDLQQEVVEHFHGCSNCESFLESLKRTKNVGAFLPELALSTDALDRVAAKAKKELGI